MNKKKISKIEYVVSACLAGVPCRWNGKAKTNQKILDLFVSGKAIAICPEVMVGLGIPRPACEIIGGEGSDVLFGKAKILDKSGRDHTKLFVKGARMAWLSIKKHNIKKAILKSGSPSCGCNFIPFGDFSGRRKKGKGVFTVILRENRVKVKEVN